MYAMERVALGLLAFLSILSVVYARAPIAVRYNAPLGWTRLVRPPVPGGGSAQKNESILVYKS